MFGEWESKGANCARSKTGLRHENDPQEDQCADTRLEFPTSNTLSSWPVQFVTLIHFVEVFLHFRPALLKDRIHIFVVSCRPSLLQQHSCVTESIDRKVATLPCMLFVGFDVHLFHTSMDPCRVRLTPIVFKVLRSILQASAFLEHFSV